MQITECLYLKSVSYAHMMGGSDRKSSCVLLDKFSIALRVHSTQKMCELIANPASLATLFTVRNLFVSIWKSVILTISHKA